jgi:hypothetical protein
LYRTSYDASTKQHWISVYRSRMKLRFLVKDRTMIEPDDRNNRYPKVTTYKTALAEAELANERIRLVVDHMIHTISLQ